MIHIRRSSNLRRHLSAPLALLSLLGGYALLVAGCSGGSTGKGGVPPLSTDTTAPTVTALSTRDGATGVPLNTKFTVSFSEALDPALVTTSQFTLTGPGGTAVAGSVAYHEPTNTATFAPTSALASNTQYTATLTTGLEDLAGNALASARVWTFTTGSTSDTTRPTVKLAVPAAGAVGVATNNKLTATFSESLSPSTVTGASFTLAHAEAVTGEVTYTDVGTAARFAPSQELLANTTYTATVTTAVQDLAGNALGTAFVWTFTTGTGPDMAAPSVTATSPQANAINASVNKAVSATFNEPMDPTTLSTLSFRLTGPNDAAVSGLVSYDGLSRIATFAPEANLTGNTEYRATISTDITDVAGNPLLDEHSWTFTTGTQSTLLPVDLRSAGAFAVLAGSTVTNAGPTIVTGDLGLSPGSSVVGFPPGVVDGTIHAANPAAAQAQLDLTSAYNDAQGRSLNAISLPGNLGGLTLTPGLYANSSTVEISGTGASGILTLDAQGDPTAVFIFKTATTLTATSGTSIVLAGGAQAANIFWAVGSSATLGTSSVFYGTILADQSIALQTGATLNGRALARIGAVTLDDSDVTLP